MGFLEYFRKKKVDSIIETVKKKNLGKRYLMLLLGSLIVAFAMKEKRRKCGITLTEHHLSS